MIAAVRAEPKPHGFWQRADGKGKDSTVISPTRGGIASGILVWRCDLAGGFFEVGNTV